MTKFAFFFSYTSDTWAQMINTPGDRTAAVRQMLDSLGGSLESIYWMFGTHDGIVIADLPGSVSAAALSVAVTGTGAFKQVQTHELITQEQLGQMLQMAQNAAPAFQRPGQQP
jgi:uncharacterized protein with GYD domain